jgi:hypothetical protein
MGAVAGQIFTNENSELAFGLDNAGPYATWFQARFSGNTSRSFVINPLGGNVGIGNRSPTAVLDLGATGGQKFYVYSDGTTVKAGLGVDLSGSSRELSIFNSSSNGTTGNISLGYRHETGGAYHEKMRIESGGNVGIGTTSPQSKLMVQGAGGNGTIRIVPSSANGEAGIGFYQDTAGTTATTRWVAAVSGWGNTNKFVIGYGNGGPDFTIDTSGNVGFGATSMFTYGSSTLTNVQISNGGYSVLTHQTTSSAANGGVWRNIVRSAGVYQIQAMNDLGTGEVTALEFNRSGTSITKSSFPNGDVGIGTTNPGAKLDVKNDDGVGNGLHIVADFNRSAGTDAQLILGYYANGSSVTGPVVYAANSKPLLFAAGGAEKMRIENTGYTKITDDGDTTWNGYSFHAITQSAASQPTVMIYNDNAGGNNYGINVIHRSTSANTTGRFFLGATNNGGTENIKIYTNGNIQNTNNSYTQLSDSRLKENIVDATSKLEEIKRLRVVNWNFIGDDLKQIGMVAQEVEEIFPGLVDVTGDNQIIHGTTYENVKSLKYSVLVPILVKAIQELEARVTELENK